MDGKTVSGDAGDADSATVTIRDRETLKRERVKKEGGLEWIRGRLAQR